MSPAMTDFRRRLMRAIPFVLALGIWFWPIPAGLTREAWHLFAIFAAAIVAVILNSFPLLTASLLAVSAAVLTRTVDPGKAFAGFANQSVLLVVVAFLVANAVVKSGLGRRISLLVVSAFGRSTLGLGYSIFVTDAMIAPAFPSNTARGGVLYPIILSLAQNSGSMPDDEKNRRMGGYLMFCGMASLSVSSALWLTATSGNPIAVTLAEPYGVKINFGSWMLAASIPVLTMIALLPLILYKLFPPGVTETPDAPKAAREGTAQHGTIDAGRVGCCGGFCLYGDRMGDGGHTELESRCCGVRRSWCAPCNQCPHARRYQLAGRYPGHLYLAGSALCIERPVERARLHGLRRSATDVAARRHPWPVAYVVLLLLYVLMHYMFVSQSAQILALFDVFLGVGVKTGVPAPLMAFALLFASSYFSTITPQGGSQNVIFVGSGYLTQGELYRLGLLTTVFCLLVFLVVGTPWLLFVAR